MSPIGQSGHTRPTSPSHRRVGRAWLVLLLCGAGGLACGQGSTSSAPSKEGMGAPGAVKRAGRRLAGDTVTVTGVYRVDPVPQTKRFQGTWLEKADGGALLLSYRPVPRYYPYIDRRVEVTGHYKKIDPRAQRIVGHDHFTVRSMTLLPGQSPGPSRIPTPPTAASRADLGKQAGRWVLIHGKVKERRISPHESRYVQRLVVTLPDGYEISTQKRYLRNLRWRPDDPSTDVTVIGKVRAGPQGGGPGVAFHAVCQGRVPRCFIGYPSSRK